ncbi:MAG: outer membrane protein assembly factor BamE [Methylococcales bacterium]|nr:outer membrane protein assembly factor BamE [Methylococcales bacterium]
MRKIIFPLILLLSISITACSSIVYTLDIHQGNVITQEMIDQLRPKMSKRQVSYIMGSSMLVDVFHQKRWDYIYSEQPGGEPRKQKKLTLFFDGDELTGIQGDFRPSKMPTVRKSHETTIEVPKRNLDNTLWGKISRFFSSDETQEVEKPDLDDKNNLIELK